jgi:hypothetical protein
MDSGPRNNREHLESQGVEVLDAQSVREQKADPFFAKRLQIYPKKVRGRFRQVKWAVLLTLLGIYYLLPWVRWDRGEGAPDQAVLVDMANERAYFFFIEIWAQEVYYLTGVLIIAAVALFLVTSLFGRVWCGYACPQTVWTDLFMWVERLIEGDRSARIRLDKTPPSATKARRLGADRGHDRWRLDSIFRRRPDLAGPHLHPASGGLGLLFHRPLHGHHLQLRWPDARAGLHLHVPLAALPIRHVG